MLYIFTVIFSLVATLYLVLRSEAVQTLLVRAVADYLSAKTNTEIRIREFSLSPVRGLVIGGISVLDHRREVLFSADALGVRPGIISFSQRKINISQVFVRKGVFQLITHQGDSVLNLQRMIDHFASSDTTTTVDTIPAKPWDISVSSVRIENTRFHLQDCNEPLAESGMDYTNIDASAINLDIADIVFDGDTINANIRHLDARERSGIVLQNLAGEFEVGPRFLKARGLKIRTEHSDLSLDFSFLYPAWTAYNDFLNEVTIVAGIAPSTLDLSDIGFFASDLLTMKDVVRLSGTVKGTVANFRARDLDVHFGNHTRFHGNISALGLPDVEETFVDMNIRSLTTSREDLASFMLPGNEGGLPAPDILGSLGTVAVSGYFTGFYNDFVANLKVRTDLGNIATDLSLKRNAGPALIGYKGQLAAERFDLGKLTGNQDLLGPVTMQAGIDGKGLDLQTADLVLQARIDSIYLAGYNYRDILVNGALAGKSFDGGVRIDDPNLGLAFKGLIDLKDSIPDFNLSAEISHAHPGALKLFPRDSMMELSATLAVKCKGNNLDNLDGRISVSDLLYAEGNKVITMDQLSLVTRQDTASGKSYHLNSDFVDADITGDFSFDSLVPSLAGFVENYLESFRMRKHAVPVARSTNGQNLRFVVRTRNSDEVTAVFLPFLRIAPATVIEGQYDEKREIIVVSGRSPAMFAGGIELADWYLDAETTPDKLSVTSGASSVFLKRASPEDSLEVKIDSFRLVSTIRDDSIHYHAGWTAGQNPSNLGGWLSFSASPVIETKLTDFHVWLNDRYWTSDPRNLARIDTASYGFQDISFQSGDQALNISGILSDRKEDSLRVAFRKVDMARIERLIGSSQIDIDGILSGNLTLSRPFTNIGFVSDIFVDKFRFNGEQLGDATIKVKYEDSESRFDVDTRILYTGNAGTSMPLSLSGSYHTGGKKPRLDFTLALKNLNLKMAGPFVSDFMSGVNGLASGQVRITGTPDRPDIRGELKLMRTEFNISYLNVPFSFADVVKIDTNAFIFDKITLYDSLGNKSVLDGRITHDHFSNLRLDLRVDLDDFSVFNNTRAQNSVFYGKARATGTAFISGPTDDIRITVRASNGGKTHVVIPIDLTRSVGQADYITFVAPVSDTLAAGSQQVSASPSGLSLDLGLRVNQDAEVEVFLPDQLGNLKASGAGNLLMSMTPATPFSLSGTYTLSKGSFLFQFKSLLRLPMSILEGSTITWTGDAADANIAISAVYKTKAPLKGITVNPDQEGIRIPVECVIRLGGKLMNPSMSFSILLPNVEESIKNAVYGAIDTSNVTEVTEQAIYLMVMNQFKPVVASSSSGVDVGATSLSLVTNTINSMLSQITTNVNVNMNYKPATSTTTQEFDVGISTQLLDDRLLIDGTFGMNSYSNTSLEQTSTFVGDINVEYILTKNRRWRARAFNRTNTLSILNNNAPYTQGVGIKFQRDFATFGELFHFLAPSQGKTGQSPTPNPAK